MATWPNGAEHLPPPTTSTRGCGRCVSGNVSCLIAQSRLDPSTGCVGGLVAPRRRPYRRARPCFEIAPRNSRTTVGERCCRFSRRCTGPARSLRRSRSGTRLFTCTLSSRNHSLLFAGQIARRSCPSLEPSARHRIVVADARREQLRQRLLRRGIVVSSSGLAAA